MIALCKQLPIEITGYLINTNQPEILKHFTERKPRPLTLLAPNEDKIKKFDEMREAVASGEYSKISLDSIDGVPVKSTLLRKLWPIALSSGTKLGWMLSLKP